LKISNLCDHNTSTLRTDRQTDGQTDGQTTCDRNTALCTKVHCAVKTVRLCTWQFSEFSDAWNHSFTQRVIMPNLTALSEMHWMHYTLSHKSIVYFKLQQLIHIWAVQFTSQVTGASIKDDTTQTTSMLKLVLSCPSHQNGVSEWVSRV